MNPSTIIRIPILPFNMVNAHLILGEKGAILVDAGLPGTEHKIEKALARQGLRFEDIRLIVITHAHVDHAGNAVRLRALSGAPILAHYNDLKYYRREAPMTFCATGWFGRLFLKTRLMHEPYTAFTPDILLREDETRDLAEFGIDGIAQPTPGHTAGSISVRLATREALVGDLLASGILLGGIVLNGYAKRPPFEEDPQATGAALQHLVDAGAERFYVGHGGPLHAHEVLRHVRSLSSLERSAR